MKWIIILVLAFLVFGLWFYPEITKNLISLTANTGKLITGYVAGVVG